MIKLTFSMLLAVALPFAMVGCVTDPTSESDYDDDQAEESESVGEAESGLTVLDCCLQPWLTGCSTVIVSPCPPGGGGTCTYRGYGGQQSTLNCPSNGG